MSPSPLPPTAVGAQLQPDLAFRGIPAVRTFFVDAGGRPGATGSAADPWPTIRHAMQTLDAGDQAIIRAGTYQEDDLDAVKAGKATSPIRVAAAPGERVVVTGTPTGTRPFFVLDQPYWVLDGIEINGRGQAGNGVRIRSDHVVVSNVDVHHCGGPAAVWFRDAKHAALIDSTVHDQRHGIEDGHGILIAPDCSAVLVARTHCYRNDGDAVQCQWDMRINPSDPEPVEPQDVWIVDNRFERDRENAVDLKRCTRVTVRGNTFSGYRPSNVPATTTNQSPQGAALVLHFGAAAILVEHNRIEDCGMGASMGALASSPAGTPPLGDVVFRRNLVVGIRQVVVDRPGGALTSPGHGIAVSNAATVDIYHNTFADIAGAAVRLGKEGALTRCLLMNNIVAGAALVFDVNSADPARLQSDRNVVWNGAAGAARFAAGGPPQPFGVWQATGQDATSVEKKPEFGPDPRITGYHTSKTSPARDAAQPLTAEPICGSNPDIGAVESCG